MARKRKTELEEEKMTDSNLSRVIRLLGVNAMYTRCSSEQPGVAERSDADDRLRRALNDSLQGMFIENM